MYTGFVQRGLPRSSPKNAAAPLYDEKSCFFATNSMILCPRAHPIDPLIIAIPFIHMRARYMTRVRALTPWRRIVAVMCFRGLRSRKMTGVDRPRVWFTIPRCRACSTRRAICEVAQLRAARATWAGRASSGTEPLLRPRGENPEIRVVKSMSCVVIIHPTSPFWISLQQNFPRRFSWI